MNQYGMQIDPLYIRNNKSQYNPICKSNEQTVINQISFPQIIQL